MTVRGMYQIVGDIERQQRGVQLEQPPCECAPTMHSKCNGHRPTRFIAADSTLAHIAGSAAGQCARHSSHRLPSSTAQCRRSWPCPAESKFGWCSELGREPSIGRNLVHGCGETVANEVARACMPCGPRRLRDKVRVCRQGSVGIISNLRDDMADGGRAATRCRRCAVTPLPIRWPSRGWPT